MLRHRRVNRTTKTHDSVRLIRPTGYGRACGRALRNASPVLGSAGPRVINPANSRGLALPMTFFDRAGRRIFFAMGLTAPEGDREGRSSKAGTVWRRAH